MGAGGEAGSQHQWVRVRLLVGMFVTATLDHGTEDAGGRQRPSAGEAPTRPSLRSWSWCSLWF